MSILWTVSIPERVFMATIFSVNIIINYTSNIHAPKSVPVNYTSQFAVSRFLYINAVAMILLTKTHPSQPGIQFMWYIDSPTPTQGVQHTRITCDAEDTRAR